MSRDHLPVAVRAAHDKVLDAWDALTDDLLQREGRHGRAKPALTAKPHEAALAAL